MKNMDVIYNFIILDIKDEYQRFGIKINDAKRFALCLKDMDYLVKL